MAENLILQAASGVADPAKIRVVTYASNRLVHMALADLVKPLTEEIALLKTRISQMESK